MASSRIKGITIEIGGDTTKLVSALSKVDSAIRETQTNLRDINKALKLDPSNTELLTDKQNELTKAVEQAKEKLENEKKAMEQLKQSDGFDATSKQAQDLKTQIDLDTAALKDAEKQLKDFGSVGVQQMKLVSEKTIEVGNKMKDLGEKIEQVGSDMTQKVTAPIVAGFGAAVKVTADFDSQMSKVQAISGATGEEFDQLRDKARELGSSTKFSATEAGQALEYMGMAGWKTEDMLEGISGIMNLAAASGEELGTTSDIVTDALTAFGMSADESGRFADILAAAATNANTNVSMLGESFKYVAPVAGSLGYSAEDVSIALGLMANSGIKASMAGTSLRNMFQRMAKPTEESENAMARLGLSLANDEGEMYSFREIMDQLRESFSDINMSAEDYDQQLNLLDAALEDGTITQSKYNKALEELNKQAFGAEGAEKARAAAMLGGTRAMSGLLAIANASTEDYEKLTKAIDNSSDSFARLADGSVVPLNEALASGEEIMATYEGQAAAMAATMQDNLGGDVTTLKSMLEELAISFGDLLMPTIREVVAGIKNVVDWLNSLDEGQKKTIIKIAAVVAAIGPVLIVIGKIAGAIGTIITVVGKVQAAIAVLTPIFTAMGTFITGTMIPAITAVAAPVLAVVAAIAAVIAIIVLCVKHWDEIKEAAARAVEFMKQKWEDFKNTMSNVWNNIKTKVTQTADNIKTSVSNAWSNLVSSVTNYVENLKAKIVNTFENVKNSISNTIGNIKNTIVNGFATAVNYIKSLPGQALQWGADIINGIVNGIRNAIGKIAEAAKSIASTISSYIHFSEPDVGPLSDFHTYMPDMMGELASGIVKGIPQLKDAMSEMAGAMVPQMGGMGGTTNNSNVISLNIYGAQGQDVNELAQIIEQTITDNVIRRGVAFS